MCGITGFNWKDAKLLQNMCDAIRHRGPDDEGAYVDDSVSLGHRRLSILDLSEKGHQPMYSENGDLVLIYNGEVYNFLEIKEDLLEKGHHFNSRTDTEVILHSYQEYGTDCVQHFNGMWAFCIYDKTKQTLFLSRDRFGIKPLYYYYDGSSFIFASEIKAILEHDIPRKENRAIIFDYLYYNLTDHTEDTFFEGIRRLMPGHNLVFDLRNGKMEINRYYDVHERLVEGANDSDRLREIFTDAVRKRLIADVPVGSCLSGGIDSSSIVVTMRKVDPDALIKTFSLRFPDMKIDETVYQKEISEMVSSVSHAVTPEPSELMRDLEDLFMTQEEPFSGTSVYGQYRVMKLAQDSGIKVLLDGQGADEVLAGYHYFHGYYYYELLKGLDIPHLMKETNNYYSKSGSLSPLTYLLLRATSAGMKKLIYNHRKVPFLSQQFIKENQGRKDSRWHLSSLDEALYESLMVYSLPHLLRFEDKNSMRFSIESRVPFLDYRFVEYAFSMPSEMKIHEGVTKYAFRKAMEGELPQSILSRYDKIGFATPEQKWLQEKSMIELMRDIIASDSFRSRDFWNAELVADMYNRMLTGESSGIFVGTEIWRCISVELWMRLYIEKQRSSLPVPVQAPVPEPLAVLAPGEEAVETLS
ncbi:asparagine synthase (glutamine-hydrolyzing) [Methanolobus chelungpuianus]|uniref:Putative asparagine synthetase [glutamine-hydrolyzing] n=1 Tax=Methanolobus chelungpuianus TaxID=502115 RepID=A0AAE3KXV8_9EURY|nr:asparagine synthase (glutamine-hydrolyzing) [Methanolobus chelungpuianus]MCQ6963395.1 asparagine synthase [Methanolobus chelungpuianus]